MASEEHLSRPELTRTEPIRTVINHLHEPDRSSSTDDAAKGSGTDQASKGSSAGQDSKGSATDQGPKDPSSGQTLQPEALDQAVLHAVNLGYTVIEEQIRQGRRAAERIRNRSYGTPEIEEDVKTLIARAMSTTRELGVVCFEMMLAVMRDPGLLSALEGRGGSEKGPRPPGAGQPAENMAAAIDIELSSSRRAQVSLDLHPRSARFVPYVSALYSTDGQAHALTSVRFILGPDRTRVLLKIEVPDDLPVANYVGVIVDSESHEPGGTLQVRIEA